MRRLTLALTVMLIVLTIGAFWLTAQQDANKESESQEGESALSVSRFRGVMAGFGYLHERSLDILAWDWGANLLRVCLGHSGWCPFVVPRADFDTCCREEALLELDWLIDECEERGIRVIIDLHQFPGYYYMGGQDDHRLWTDESVQESFVDFWRTIAGRYADRGDVIYGYDLLNEPNEVSAETWIGVAQKAIDAIREVDTQHAVIIESIDWAQPRTFSSLLPVNDDNAIYSFHFYQPLEFAQQRQRPPYVEQKYPSEEWSKNYLRDVLQPVRDFQLKHEARILAGEFCVVAWAPTDSRTAYLRDVMELFEEYGYDYTYSHYMDWGGGSLTHEGVSVPWGHGMYQNYVGETPALQLFKEFLAKNERPARVVQLPEYGECIFDESHWDHSTSLSEETATNADTRELAWRLGGLLEVERHQLGLLDESLLAGVELLVTGSPYGRAYTQAEISAIHGYVRAGGALLFYAGENPPLPSTRIRGINLLLAPFGIEYRHTLLASSVPAWFADNPRAFAAPSISAAPDLMDFDTGSHFLVMTATLELQAPAVPILLTDSDSWNDLNWDTVRDPGEPSCPCPVIAVAEHGRGRVAVVAHQGFGEMCNWGALKEVLGWLLESK